MIGLLELMGRCEELVVLDKVRFKGDLTEFLRQNLRGSSSMLSGSAGTVYKVKNIFWESVKVRKIFGL